MYTPAARKTFHPEFPWAILCLRRSIGPPPSRVNLGSPGPRSGGMRAHGCTVPPRPRPGRRQRVLRFMLTRHRFSDCAFCAFSRHTKESIRKDWSKGGALSGDLRGRQRAWVGYATACDITVATVIRV